MIPRSDVDVVVDVDPSHLTTASPDDVITGMACIHEYENGAFSVRRGMVRMKRFRPSRKSFCNWTPHALTKRRSMKRPMRLGWSAHSPLSLALAAQWRLYVQPAVPRLHRAVATARMLAGAVIRGCSSPGMSQGCRSSLTRRVPLVAGLRRSIAGF